MSNQSSAPDSSSNEIARTSLKEILSVRSWHGANLKVLVAQRMRERGVDPAAFFRFYPKFTAFLAANSDLVEVVPKEGGGGDVTVSLRTDALAPRIETQGLDNLRLDAWKAFTNPDTKRKRFLHRDTGAIHHFTEPPTTSNDKSWAQRIRGDSKFIEIQYADAATQSQWMREFLDVTPGLPDWMRRAARHLADVPYDSALDSAYASALGPQFGEAWKHFRSANILTFIQEWAKRNEIAFSRLLKQDRAAQVTVQPTTRRDIAAEPLPRESVSEFNAAFRDSAPQRSNELEAFLGSCTNDELRSLMLPATLVLRLLRERR